MTILIQKAGLRQLCGLGFGVCAVCIFTLGPSQIRFLVQSPTGCVTAKALSQPNSKSLLIIVMGRVDFGFVPDGRHTST